MTDITDIISDNWDTGIVAKPSIIKDDLLNRRFYNEVVATRISVTIDDIEGIVARQHFSPDSHDAYICWVESLTEVNTKKYIKAIKKICATYIPVSGQENILEWNGGEWTIFNGVRYIFKFVLIVRKSGIAGY